jgi:formate-dependent nitrite reductase membrane component NrfD
VLLRPQWRSWLVRGGYIITVFGLLATVFGVTTLFDIKAGSTILLWITAFFAVMLAIYTAFLFAQAKGRDFWQSPSLALHMLVHSVMAGAAVFAIISMFVDVESWLPLIKNVLIGTLVVNLFTMLLELTMTHPTRSAHHVVQMIVKGRYKNLFWFGVVLIGNVLPLILLLLLPSTQMLIIASVLSLIGMYFTEKIWIEAPQRIPLA